MDGYASDSSSMHVDGVKSTVYNACPAHPCDSEIMSSGPHAHAVGGHLAICWPITVVCGALANSRHRRVLLRGIAGSCAPRSRGSWTTPGLSRPHPDASGGQRGPGHVGRGDVVRRQMSGPPPVLSTSLPHVGS
jgi:hypothetical protein